MKRPCATCVRSHTYARAHAVEGDDVPSQPDCTYGDEPEKQPRPVNKVRKLENRISELEALLEKMQSALQLSQGQGPVASGSSVSYPVMSEMTAMQSDASNTPSTGFMTPLDPSYNSAFIDEQELFSALGSTDMSAVGDFDMADFSATTSYMNSNAGASSSYLDPSAGALVSTSFDFPNQLQLLDWPPNLPDPATTRHLIQAFFAFHMHAGRLFHGPTFLAALDLPRTDPRFPPPCILHAMCAVGSLYTADIPQPPVRPRRKGGPPREGYLSVDELFRGRWRQYERRPDSFAETQARFAKAENEGAIDRGERLLECMQAHVLLVYFYLYQARWSEAYLASGQLMRAAVPLGLHMSTQLPPNTMDLVNYSEKPPSVIGAETSALDGELRRNVFWLAYALERQGASGTNYPMVLDDQDIIQLLPLRGDKFEQAVTVPIEDRQWAHDKTIFLSHPPSQTDSFTLFTKSMILLSHVKTFTIRIRGKAMVFPLVPVFHNPTYDMPGADPRASAGFQQLDAILQAFPPSFPPQHRRPIQDETVDPYLFTALSAAYMAQIMLHEPHARMGAPHDVSTARTLSAARAILDLMYALGSTSYDLALLDHLPILSWNRCARVLIQALKAAAEHDDYEHSAALQAEIAYVHSMLTRAGERMPFAYRYKQMVHDYLAQTCGAHATAPLRPASFHTARWDPAAASTSTPSIYAPGTFL